MINFDYLYNKDAFKKNATKNYFVDKKLSFQVLEQGTILPYKKTVPDKIPHLWGAGGIVDKDGKHITNSFVSSYLVSQAYTPPPESVKHISETVVYLGMFLQVWGHHITDNISRLWFLKSDEFKKFFKDCALVYVPVTNRGVVLAAYNRNFLRLLEILEVDINKFYPITQPMQFDKIILPDRAFDLGKTPYFTDEYRQTISCIQDFALKNRTPTSSKKLYYFYGRFQIGEERLAEYFKSKGYEIIRPEKFTLDEQLNLLMNCESFASTLGSCAHNSVFLREGTEVLFIPRRVNRLTFHQPIINQVSKLNVKYIDSTLSIFSVYQILNCYIISEQLKRFFGDKFEGYKENDFKIFLQYVKSSLESGRKVNREAKRAYDKVLRGFMTQLKEHEDLIAACDMPPSWATFQPTLSYQTHVHHNGWEEWTWDNQASNPLDQKLAVQAIKINYPGYKVHYSVYYGDKEGWSEDVLSPAMVGTTGKNKPILGMKIRLDEKDLKKFDISYRIHKFDGEWTDWAKNGEELYSNGVNLNAIQVKLEPKRK